MTKSEFFDAINELLELDPGTISDATELNTINEWDSLAKLSVVAFLDSQFDVFLSGDKLEQISTGSDLVDLAGL